MTSPGLPGVAGRRDDLAMIAQGRAHPLGAITTARALATARWLWEPILTRLARNAEIVWAAVGP
jgi:hypothetical protein